MNKTHSQVRESRDAIESLVNVTIVLEHRVEFLHTESKKLFPQLQYIELNLHINGIFQMITRAILDPKLSIHILLQQRSEAVKGAM